MPSYWCLWFELRPISTIPWLVKGLLRCVFELKMSYQWRTILYRYHIAFQRRSLPSAFSSFARLTEGFILLPAIILRVCLFLTFVRFILAEEYSRTMALFSAFEHHSGRAGSADANLLNHLAHPFLPENGRETSSIMLLRISVLRSSIDSSNRKKTRYLIKI